MIALPLVGFLAGAVLGNRWAIAVTCAAAAIGFSLVGVFTDEISGWGDGFLWGDLIVALILTGLGIVLHRWFVGRRARPR
jgi:hypothetical protein